MADKSGIEWTDATWNPVTGCAKVSAGCKNCYAERDWARLKHLPTYAGRAFTDVACHPERLDQPLRWRRPRRIFVNSLSDLFHPAVPDEFISQVFAVMGICTHHTFQVLTKRPERMLDWFSRKGRKVDGRPSAESSVPFWMDNLLIVRGVGILWDGTWPLPNVWIGVSVEDQASADKRIPLLLKTPAAVRWVSAEPLLGPVDLYAVPVRDTSTCCGAAGDDDDVCYDNPLSRCFDRSHGVDGASIDWLVVGGESGPKARGMDPEWARSLRDQCAAAGVPFHFKQWGAGCPIGSGLSGAPLKVAGYDFSERNGGRVLDGVVHDAYPEVSHG